jgi:predicted acyltransferase
VQDNLSQDRLISLDVFRGITIAGMVLVNNPGWSPVYWPLDHAEWNGLTPTDWIFPFFLFIVGVAIPMALGKRIEEGITSKVYTKIISRAAMIFGLGLAISVLPFFQFTSTNAPDWLKMAVWLSFAAALLFLLLRNFKVAGILAGVAILGIVVMNLAGYNVVPYDFGTMRIFGVLQRIAVCYLVTALIFLHTNWRQQLGIAVALLFAYWLVMTTIPVPGCEITTIDDKACNLAAYIDRMILGENHIWRGGKVYDPEGILSTIPAIATTISGVLAGTWLSKRDVGGAMKDETATKSSPPYKGGVAAASADGVVLSESAEKNPVAPAPGSDASNKVSGLFFFGALLLAVGFIWNSFFPFNKALWTSSYVVITSGLALLTLGFCYWLVDIKGYKAWAKPFMIFGANALALFVFSGIFARMISAYKIAAGPEGQPWSLQKTVVQNVFLALFQPINASLAYAICFILLWLFLMWLLYRKKIFIKV